MILPGNKRTEVDGDRTQKLLIKKKKTRRKMIGGIN